eukprot:scaffold12240_cov77-Attheya_sp.AAC.4
MERLPHFFVSPSSCPSSPPKKNHLINGQISYILRNPYGLWQRSTMCILDTNGEDSLPTSMLNGMFVPTRVQQ